MSFRPALLAITLAALAVPLLPSAAAYAQGQVEFGGMEHDTSDPVEVVSDTLEVNEERLHASGGVVLTSGEDSAEAQEAVYTLATGEVVMTGDVLMTQGGNLLSGQTLRLNMETGNGIMEGRVRTTFSPGNGN